MSMPAFQSAIVNGLDSSASRVIRAVQVAHSVDLASQPSLVYRAIGAYKKQIENVDNDELNYKNLTGFLGAFYQANPSSRIVCQLDDEGRFFRLFLSVGCIIEGQSKWLPVLENDGTHMRGSSYNGVCLTLVGKSGDGSNIPAAVAFVHKETVDNFAWFYANCLAAEIYFHDRPLFTDRGKQLEAQQLLSRLGFQVHLKFCSLHLELNTIHRFKSVEPSLSSGCSLLYKLQAASTMAGYDRVLGEIREAYPHPLHHGDGTVEYVADYLEQLNPTSWTRVGNYSPSPAEIAAISKRWPSTPSYGALLPLFGTRITSANESENNALSWFHVRLEDVPRAVLRFCERAISTCRNHRVRTEEWLALSFNLTPKAKKLIDVELALVPRMVVLESTKTEYYVDETNQDSNNNTYTRRYLVDVNVASCTRCPVREHYQIPCRHLLAAIKRARGHNAKTKEEIERLFHPEKSAITWAGKAQ